MQLMLLLPAICHIGKWRAVVGPGRILDARQLLPFRRVDRGEIRIAFGPGVNFGDFKAVGDVTPLRVDLRTADHGNLTTRRPRPATSATARASENEFVTTAPPARKWRSRVRTILVRPGSGRRSDMKVLRPITTGLPVVIALKRCMSHSRRHGIAPLAPITPLSATATMSTPSISAHPPPAR